VTGLLAFSISPSAGLSGTPQSGTDIPGITVIRVFKVPSKHSLAALREEEREKKNDMGSFPFSQHGKSRQEH
jgi:hypothetical protein